MSEHLVLGIHEPWGRKMPLVIPHADRRHHLYVIGKSGTGKTTLLENMAIQDIEAGHGFAVLDPHGDYATRLLSRIPPHRVKDVVYVEPSDLEFPIGLNLLEKVEPDKQHLVASEVVSVFKNMWADFWGPRLEYILYASVAAVLESENVTLLAVQRMLSDARYRAWIVKRVKDPMVRSFWLNEFENYNDRFLQEAIAPIQNKIGQLFMAPHLRNILGQVRSRIDFRFMMDNGRIFIANLAKGKLGADKSNLLGSLLVTEFQLAAMSRAEIPETERRDFYLYVDEFQSFATDSFASILSEARKYRLCLTLSHQFMSQVKPSILDAVLGNVGSIAAFRVGHDDAHRLEMAFGGSVGATRFSGLNNGEICAKLLAHGVECEPSFGFTLPPAVGAYGNQDAIIRQSRQRYAKQRALVEDKIERWMTN